jgi:hypothetical protein
MVGTGYKGSIGFCQQAKGCYTLQHSVVIFIWIFLKSFLFFSPSELH